MVNGKPSPSCSYPPLCATPAMQPTPAEVDLPRMPEKSLLQPASVSSLSDIEIQDLSASKVEGGEWQEVRSRGRRRKRSNSSVSLSASNNTVCSTTKPGFSSTLFFAAVNSNQRITSLSSLRVSQALEKLCPESLYKFATTASSILLLLKLAIIRVLGTPSMHRLIWHARKSLRTTSTAMCVYFDPGFLA